MVGKTELREPLGSSRQEAQRKVHAAIVRFEAILDAARAKLTSGDLPKLRRPLSAEKIANVHYAEALELDEAERDFVLPTAQLDLTKSSPNGWRMLSRPRRRLTYSGLGFGMATPKPCVGSRAVARLMTRCKRLLVGRSTMFTERRNTSVKPETAEWRQLARSLAAVQLEALARADERDEGDLTGEPKLPVLRHDTPADVLPISGDKARILCAESKLPLSQILPRMHAEKRNLRDSTKAEQRVAVRMFEEFLGEPTPVYKISRRTMIDYKNALLQTPSNYLTRFKGKSLPQAIEANKRRKEPFPILSVTTINGKWLTHVGSIFQWAANNGFLPDNPCQHVRVDEGKSGGEPSRVPFTADDLAKIFGHPSFADPVAYDEREWAVLIALFTGMRGGEIAQLTLEGIKRERGELVFTVGGKLKNEGSRRIVPVHSTLSALGLERRIERLRKTGKTFLFPEWYARAEEIMTNAARKGHTTQSAYAEVIPKAFNRFLLKQVEITDTRKVFHSFRHTFKTSLSHAGVSREVNDVLTGHHDNSAGAGYVHDISIDRMKKAIEKLHFDVRLPICDMKTAAGF